MEPRSAEQFISANKHHFDSEHVSQKHDEQPLHAEMAKRIGKALLKAYPFDDENTTVLDFACGTGLDLYCLNSRVLAPYVKSIVGVDISQEMVDRYNKRVENQGIPREEMRAICIPEQLQTHANDLRLAKLLGDIEFDVAICCMSYHHFPSISSITRTLSSLLKPGGHLYIADVESIPIQSTPHGPSNNSVVMHKYGFSKLEMKDVFVQAGLADIDAASETGHIGSRFTYSIATRAFKKGKAVNIFLARGVKPQKPKP
ncbi:S-adenosyl-L-methionine-dependent methyltransferase [Lentinula edodes]|uniref:S-adenosyl-L-methionine-dependent methyltransferase n=1 Tax=Lentinula edodes TaxID=5353 RepID=UPI001E8CDECC|nr:S-adenosyl-L-methionine-dependent methyltransferase [Lentinula edodes]KAH7874442.1 S-adenosyl-L-methionine-dependent methyltransferase [Lentinula edodes]